MSMVTLPKFVFYYNFCGSLNVVFVTEKSLLLMNNPCRPTLFFTCFYLLCPDLSDQVSNAIEMYPAINFKSLSGGRAHNFWDKPRYNLGFEGTKEHQQVVQWTPKFQKILFKPQCCYHITIFASPQLAKRMAIFLPYLNWWLTRRGTDMAAG